MLRIILGGLTAFCAALAGIAVFRTIDAARYALSPEEATLLLVYAIPPGSVPRTAGNYFIVWEGQAVDGRTSRQYMRIKRNAGCRVEMISRAVGESGPDSVAIENRIYDWSKVLVDGITFKQVAVPGQGYEACNVFIELPGKISGVRQVDGTIPPEVPPEGMGSISFEWGYAPGQDSAYARRKGPFLELMQRCTGKVPKLPELRGPLIPARGIAT